MDDPKKRFTKPEPEDVEPIEAPPSQPVLQITMEQLRELIAAGRSDLNVAEAIAKGVAQVREPIPENKIHNGVSYNNPSGNEHPIPALRCDMYLGVIDGDTVKAAWKYELEQLRDREVVALNLLRPTDQKIRLFNGEDMQVLVTERRHPTTDAPIRVTIGVPLGYVQSKGDVARRSMVPHLLDMVKQLYGIDLESMRQSEVDAIKAEHRKGNYVAQAVAA